MHPRQFHAHDEVELLDDDGEPLGIRATVLADEAVDDTHIRVEGTTYPADSRFRVCRDNLRLVTACDA